MCDHCEEARALGRAVSEFLEILKWLEEPEVLEFTEVPSREVLEEVSRELKACQDLFLDKAWHLAEWAPLRSWQGMEADVKALHVLGRELGFLQGKWQGALKSGVADIGGLELPMDCEEAIEDYRELGRRLEEGVKVACPWPGLREGLAEQKGKGPTFFLGSGLSPSS